MSLRGLDYKVLWLPSCLHCLSGSACLHACFDEASCHVISCPKKRPTWQEAEGCLVNWGPQFNSPRRTESYQHPREWIQKPSNLEMTAVSGSTLFLTLWGILNLKTQLSHVHISDSQKIWSYKILVSLSCLVSGSFLLNTLQILRSVLFALWQMPAESTVVTLASTWMKAMPVINLCSQHQEIFTADLGKRTILKWHWSK